MSGAVNDDQQQQTQPHHADTLGQKTAWNMVATVANIGSSTVAGIVVARLLGPNGVGEVGYLVWLATFLASAFSLGLPFAITKFLAEYIGRRDDSVRPALTGWISRTYAASLLAGGALILATWLVPRAEHYLGAFSTGWLAVYVIVTGLSSLYQAYLAGSQQFRRSAKLMASSAVLQVVFVVVGAKWFGNAGAIVGYLSFLVLPALGALTLIASRGRAGESPRAELGPELRRRVMRYAVDTWLAGLVAAIVWTRAELFFLEHYFSKDIVGYFNVALSMAALGTQLPVLLSGALLPHMAQRLGEGQVEKVQALYASATRILAFVAFPLAAAIAGSSPVLVPLMYGRAFTPAVGSAAVLVSVAAVAAAASAGSSLVYAAERSSFILLCGVVGSVAVVACGVTVVPRFGAAGAAWSRAVIQVAMVAWGMWFIATKLRYHPPIASLLKTAIASAACGAAAFAVTYQWHYSRWSLPLALAASAVSYLALTWLIKPLDPADTQALWQVATRTGGGMLRRFVPSGRGGVEGIS